MQPGQLLRIAVDNWRHHYYEYVPSLYIVLLAYMSLFPSTVAKNPRAKDPRSPAFLPPIRASSLVSLRLELMNLEKLVPHPLSIPLETPC